jgi:hypothetical protein
MKKNSILLSLIVTTGGLFITAFISNDMVLATKLTDIGIITGISALFVKDLIKQKKTEE